MSAEVRAWAFRMLDHFGRVHPDMALPTCSTLCLHCGRLMCPSHPDEGFYDCVGPGKHEASWEHEVQ